MSRRRIDHLVLAVDDLDQAAAYFKRIGFQVGARNRHPWGTDNRLIQFQSSFLELITVADADLIPPHRPGVFSFGAFVRDYLRRREGLAMVALDSDDAVDDAARFARAGIGDYRPFTFERSGRDPDGTETHVAFSLAFALDDLLPEVSFFVCQQHYPHAFWNPQLQQHPNGATDIIEIALMVQHPRDHTAFLGGFTGSSSAAQSGRYHLANAGALQLTTGTGAPGLTAFIVVIDDADRLDAQLTERGIDFHKTDDRIEVTTSWRNGAVGLAFQATTPAT